MQGGPTGTNFEFAICDSEIANRTDPSLARKIRLLLLFRLLLGLFFLLLTIFARTRHGWEFLSAHLQPLYFFSIVIFLFTIVATLSLKHIDNLARFAYLQLFFDVEAVTVLIFLSGGIESLFSFLYMPVIISAALLLNRKGSLWVASLCSLSYGLLLDLQYFDWIVPLQVIGGTPFYRESEFYVQSLLMNIAGFYLVAYLSGYLAEELKKSSQLILEHKKDFQELETLHRNIVRSITSGLLTISADGIIRFCNPACEEILGLPKDRLERCHVSDIFPSVEISSGSHVGLTSDKNPFPNGSRNEIVYPRPDGQELRLGYTGSILLGDDGASSGWIFIFQDLTRLKAMEEHMRRMERLAIAGNIAAEIAHEIKNPLASISGAVELIQDTVQHDAEQMRLFGIMHREVQRIDDLVTDFLWLARGARQSVKKEAVAVVENLQEILALLQNRKKFVPSHRIKTSFEIAPVISIDAHHFRQIIWNLVTNALEAMPQGGELSIHVRPEAGSAESNNVRIDIRDTGNGIAEGIRTKVTEPFFSTKTSGTGLGLSIVYQLVENSAGRIEVTHHEDSGTTFSLFFPISPPFPLAK